MPYWTSIGEHTEREIKAPAVDGCDTVYVVSCRSAYRGIIVTYVLHVLDAGYNVKHVGPLLEEEYFDFMQIASNRNNDIIVIKDDDFRVYVFDNSGKLKHKFERDPVFVFYFSISLNTNKTTRRSLCHGSGVSLCRW